MKPYYLMVTFWGKAFREKFYSTCLASAMSENNIPILKNISGSKFIICTTEDDWSWLILQPLFVKMQSYIEAYFINIGFPAVGENLQLHMSKGHIEALKMAQNDNAYAGFYAPDLYISDGLIKFIIGKAKIGYKGVLTVALRFSEESVAPKIKKKSTPHEPLRLSTIEISKIAIDSLHSELLRYIVNHKYYDDYPIWSIWKDSQTPSLIVHTVSWALLLGDFEEENKFSINMLKHGTIDGFFVYENFYLKYGMDRLYLSKDSLDCMFLSTTSEKDLTYLPLREVPINSSELSDIHKKYYINKILFSKEIDEFRRQAYCVPFIIRAKPMNSNIQTILFDSVSFVKSAISMDQLERLSSEKKIKEFYWPSEKKIKEFYWPSEKKIKESRWYFIFFGMISMFIPLFVLDFCNDLFKKLDPLIYRIGKDITIFINSYFGKIRFFVVRFIILISMFIPLFVLDFCNDIFKNKLGLLIYRRGRIKTILINSLFGKIRFFVVRFIILISMFIPLFVLDFCNDIFKNKLDLLIYRRSRAITNIKNSLFRIIRF